jgi:hypothetical protein
MAIGGYLGVATGGLFFQKEKKNFSVELAMLG